MVKRIEYASIYFKKQFGYYMIFRKEDNNYIGMIEKMGKSYRFKQLCSLGASTMELWQIVEIMKSLEGEK